MWDPALVPKGGCLWSEGPESQLRATHSIHLETKHHECGWDDYLGFLSKSRTRKTQVAPGKG